MMAHFFRKRLMIRFVFVDQSAAEIDFMDTLALLERSIAGDWDQSATMSAGDGINYANYRYFHLIDP